MAGKEIASSATIRLLELESGLYQLRYGYGGRCLTFRPSDMMDAREAVTIRHFVSIALKEFGFTRTPEDVLESLFWNLMDPMDYDQFMFMVLVG